MSALHDAADFQYLCRLCGLRKREHSIYRPRAVLPNSSFSSSLHREGISCGCIYVVEDAKTRVSSSWVVAILNRTPLFIDRLIARHERCISSPIVLHFSQVLETLTSTQSQQHRRRSMSTGILHTPTVVICSSSSNIRSPIPKAK